MSKVFGKRGILIFFALLIGSPVCAFAQDLGSSSGIFRAPKTSTPRKPVKPKTSVASRRNSSKSTGRTANRPPRAAAKTTEPRETAATADAFPTAVTDPQPQNNIVITVGDQTSGDFDELFEQAVEEGNTARDNRDYVKAEAAYRRGQNLKSADSRAVYGLGNIYADQQRWEEAEKSYRQAISLEPQEAPAYIALSYVLTQPLAGSNLSERYSEAEKAARRAIQIDPQNAFAHDQLGVALELRGIVSAETLAAYNRAIAIEPEFALAYAHRGRLLRRAGKITESTEAFREAIRFSDDVPTMILVADVMQSQQKFLDSEELLRRALALDAKNPTALNMLGRALTDRREFDEAEKFLIKSTEVSPNSFVSHSLLGSLYLRRARLDDAEKSLNKALAVVSANERKRLAQEFEAIGDAFKKAGKTRDAQRVYRQAVALDATKTILTEKLAKAQ